MLKKLSLILLLAFAAVNVVALAPANAETTWTTWGGAPYASSYEEAVRRLPDALHDLNIPEPVRVLFLEEVRRNPQGTRAYLTPGMRFLWMMTGGARPHAMENVVVGRNPVRRGVVQAAEARGWRVVHEGRTYVLVLPDICYNWAWRTEAPPQQEIAEEPCSIVTLTIPAGRHQLLFGGLSSAAPPPSRCFAVRQGGEWEALPGGCIECISWDPVLARLPDSAAADRNVSMQSRIVVRATTVQIRVPIWFETHHLGFYLLAEDGQCSWLVVEPTDWRSHTFPFSQWRWRPQGS